MPILTMLRHISRQAIFRNGDRTEGRHGEHDQSHGKPNRAANQPYEVHKQSGMAGPPSTNPESFLAQHPRLNLENIIMGNIQGLSKIQ